MPRYLAWGTFLIGFAFCLREADRPLQPMSRLDRRGTGSLGAEIDRPEGTIELQLEAGLRTETGHATQRHAAWVERLRIEPHELRLGLVQRICIGGLVIFLRVPSSKESETVSRACF